MEEQEYIKRIHAEILEIMDVIHKICVDHHLKYYLTGGSLLGAVRHQGFIPWDDDLDIAMPRDDFDRFFEICKEHMPENYAVEDMNVDPQYGNLFAKICKTNTQFSQLLRNGKQTTIGIFVDIFPLDETSGHILRLRLRKKLARFVWMVLREKINPGSLEGVKKLVAHAIPLPEKPLRRLLHHILYMTNGRGQRYYTNFASQYSVKRKTQPKEVYGNGTPILFEKRMYMAPDDYTADLLSNFGPKYMELPPVEKRRIHYPGKVVFSDGAVFEPTNSRYKKVTVKESLNW